MALFSLTQPASQNTIALKQVWQTLDFDSCPYNYNFHMHTNCSDGQLTPTALIQQAVAIGLKGMAITDHHSITGFITAVDFLENTSVGEHHQLPHLWSGVEITSDLLGVEVHILGYGFEPKHQAIQPYLRGQRPHGDQAFAQNVISSLHQAGGLVVLAHPARYRLPAEQLIRAAAKLGIDGIEAFYAYGNPYPWKSSTIQTEECKQLAHKYNLLTTCGTDTHGSNLLKRL